MHLIEIILISVGISLNVFAVVVCFGAVLLKIDRNRHICMVSIFCLSQIVAIIAGRLLGYIPFLQRLLQGYAPLCAFLAFFILCAMGAFMLLKARLSGPFEERLSEVSVPQIAASAFMTGVASLFVGVAFCLMNAGIVVTFISILGATALLVTLGLMIGYRHGHEHRAWAYAIGGILLLVTSFEMLIRNVGLLI